MNKMCFRCKLVKGLDEFSSQPSYCKICSLAIKREWKEKNIDKYRESQRAYAERQRASDPDHREKQRSYQKSSYERNKVPYQMRAKRTYLATRKLLVEYKKTCRCSRCGESDFRCLQFHHLHDKNHAIADMVRRGFSFANIMKEIEKCEVLCANCHSKEHYAELDLQNF